MAQLLRRVPLHTVHSAAVQSTVESAVTNAGMRPHELEGIVTLKTQATRLLSVLLHSGASAASSAQGDRTALSLAAFSREENSEEFVSDSELVVRDAV